MHIQKMTTHRWMISVAIVALIFGAAAEAMRYGRLMALYKEMRGLYAASESIHQMMSLMAGTGAPRKYHGQRKDYYAQLKRKYEYAAAHPWLSVTADPPAPEP
jgi:hypothetical protein